MFALSPGRRRSRAAHTRAGGQSIVEFGLVALLFALLLMGIVDFAILLNGWLGVSSNSRDIARQAAVGMCPPTSYLPTGGTGAACVASIPNLPTPSSLVIQGVDRSATPPITVKLEICKSDLSSCYTPSQILWT